MFSADEVAERVGKAPAPAQGKASPSTGKTIPAVVEAAPEPTSPTPEGQSTSLRAEGGEWMPYLAEMTEKQGSRLETGFAGIDAAFGGLAAGLTLIVDEESERGLDFIKQLIDQMAMGSEVPVLFLSFERAKAALRLNTLSRLSGTSSKDIENGRFEKDSPEWQKVVEAGKQAVGWLERIYVAESPPPGSRPSTRWPGSSSRRATAPGAFSPSTASSACSTRAT